MNSAPSEENPKRKLNRRSFIFNSVSGLIWTYLGARELYKRREQLYFLYLRLAQDPSVENYDRALRFAEETLGTQIHFSPGYGGHVVGETVPFEYRRRILLRLLNELYKLPHNFFRHTQLPEIRFVLSLEAFVHQAEGERRQRTSLGGITVEGEGLIYISVMRNGEDRVSYALHHELFHSLHGADRHMEKGLAHWQGIMNRYHTALGGEGPYPYREGYNFNTKDSSEESNDNNDTFITDYGQTNVREDMAEFAETLLSCPAHAELLRRCAECARNSPVRIALEEKIAYIKQKYFEWSDGSMNEAYWEAFLAPARAQEATDEEAIVVYGGGALPALSGYQRFDPFYELTPAEQKAEMDRIRQNAPHLFPYEQEK